MTNWIGVSTNPIYEGFYELKYTFSSDKTYMGYWNGKEFLEIHVRNKHGKRTQLSIPIGWIESWRGISR